MFQKIYSVWMLFLVTLIIISCTQPPSPNINLNNSYNYFSKINFVDTLNTFKSFGSADAVFDGERVHFKFNITVLDNKLLFKCFDPFGSTILSISSDTDTTVIFTGNNTVKIRTDDSLSNIHIFRSYFLTAKEIVRIITGRLPSCAINCKNYDNILTNKKYITYITNSKTCSNRIKVSKKHGNVYNVIFNYGTSYVEYSNFQEGIAKYVKLSADENNYFILKLDKISINN